MARGVIHVFIEATNASIVATIVWLVSFKRISSYYLIRNDFYIHFLLFQKCSMTNDAIITYTIP